MRQIAERMGMGRRTVAGILPGEEAQVDGMEWKVAEEPVYGFADVLASINEVGFRSGVALFSTYGARSRDLAAWYKAGEINLDRNLRLQYLAGFGLNLYQSMDIYEDILSYRKYPQDIFRVSPEREEVLLKMMGIQK